MNEWLFIINDSFTALEVTSDIKKLTLVTNYVKGSVLNALIRYRTSDKNPTWEGFTQLLKTQYEDTNLEYRLRTQFYHLKFENSFSKYLRRFQELVNQLPKLSNDDILCKFLKKIVYKN